MSVDNLSMAAFANANYGVAANDYGGAGSGGFIDRAANETHSFLSQSEQTMGSKGASTSWKSRNPGHVQGLGNWNRKSTVSFDDPMSTPRVEIR
jgi:hypothetical protein